MGKKEEFNLDTRLTKNNIVTIPNGMCLFRILLIPVFVWLYCCENQHGWAIAVVAVSAITDIFDGRIARRFNMVSDVGKVLDPIADKLTQAALIIALSLQYPWIFLLFGIFVAKEITMFVMGAMVLKKADVVNSAKWYGKMATVVLELSMAALLLFEDIPIAFVNIICIICCSVLIFSLVMYVILFWGILYKANSHGDKLETLK